MEEKYEVVRRENGEWRADSIGPNNRWADLWDAVNAIPALRDVFSDYTGDYAVRDRENGEVYSLFPNPGARIATAARHNRLTASPKERRDTMEEK